MLEMLLTGDSIRKHGHEKDAPQHPAPAPSYNGSLFVQMPLAIVGSFLRRQTPSPSHPSASNEDGRVEAGNPEPSNHLMTAETQSSHVSPAVSRPASSCSSTGTDDKPKKRTPRSKTSYLCARPPRPVDSRSKLHIRPKILLQLHQVIPSQRPKPTYEVVPFSLLPPRSTRRLARTFNTRDRLCPTDLLIVKAEAYDSKDAGSKSEDEGWGSREVIGVISPAKSEKENTYICMDDGYSCWEVSNMANGGLEFNTCDDHGLTLKARWVPKINHSRRVSAMSASSLPSPTFPPEKDDRKYTFSTISPTSRRHPIIATMTQARIDIMDSYTVPLATSPPTPGTCYPQSPVSTPASIDVNSFMEKSTNQLPVETDDALRKFIVVSGIWITQAMQSHVPSLDTLSVRPSNTRTFSMSIIDSPRSASPASTIEENRRSFPKMLRTGTERLPRCTSFTEPSQSPIFTRSPNASPGLKTRSRRANSTGNANLHSMSGSMRKRYGLAFEGETVPESEEERQGKRSAELLRIKELSLPHGPPRPSSESPTRESRSHTVGMIPSPIVVPPSSDGLKSPTPLLSPPPISPALPDPERTRKTQSAYNPVDTIGMWDSGVSEGPGLRSRPTSMFVLNEKKRKQEKKRGRSRNKEDSDKGVPIKKNEWHRFKTSLKGLFKKEKA